MKIVGPVLTAAAAYFVGLASAAPAIVWKNNGSNSSSLTSHISNAMDARSLLASVGITGNNDNDASSSSALSAVIFLVERNTDGSEGLSSLLSSSSTNNNMAGVKDRYLMADEIYYHVHGVESARTMARDVRSSSNNIIEGKVGEGGKVTVAEVTMEEFQRKLASLAQSEIEEAEEGEIASIESSDKKITKAQQKRRKAISEADVLVVSVANKSNEEDAAKQLDATIVAAIDSSAIRNVVLSSIRSTDEVKHARKLAVVERLTKNWSSTSSSSTRRRLEDVAAAAGDDNVNNAQSESEAGIYYVNMTPNIFAGLLFFFMFVMTAHIGLTCMNMIEGQDVYVKKMPHIGREV